MDRLEQREADSRRTYSVVSPVAAGELIYSVERERERRTAVTEIRLDRSLTSCVSVSIVSVEEWDSERHSEWNLGKNFTTLNNKIDLLPLRCSVPGACSVSNSRRMRYSKSLENDGSARVGTGRAAFDWLLCRPTNSHVEFHPFSVPFPVPLPECIRRVRVIELRERWMPFSPLWEWFWADWSSRICWVISIEFRPIEWKKNLLSIIPSYCWLCNGCPPSSLAMEEFRRRCCSAIVLGRSRAELVNEQLLSFGQGKVHLPSTATNDGGTGACVAGDEVGFDGEVFVLVIGGFSEFELSSITRRLGHDGDVWNEKRDDEEITDVRCLLL